MTILRAREILRGLCSELGSENPPDDVTVMEQIEEALAELEGETSIPDVHLEGDIQGLMDTRPVCGAATFGLPDRQTTDESLVTCEACLTHIQNMLSR